MLSVILNFELWRTTSKKKQFLRLLRIEVKNQYFDIIDCWKTNNKSSTNYLLPKWHNCWKLLLSHNLNLIAITYLGLIIYVGIYFMKYIFIFLRNKPVTNCCSWIWTFSGFVSYWWQWCINGTFLQRFWGQTKTQSGWYQSNSGKWVKHLPKN